MKHLSLTRRRFLRSASLAVATPAIVPSSVLGRSETAPSNRIAMGVVGLGGMGTGNLHGFLNQGDTTVVAVCDVHDLHYRDKAAKDGRSYGREPARKLVEAHYSRKSARGDFKGCRACVDFREVCARDDIDAVVVATPDHWHAICTLAALRSGKDVYCEKPLTHFFAEGQAICREVKRRKAVFQTGSQQRSQVYFRIAAEIVLNGLIGKVRSVEVGLPAGHSTPRTKGVEPAEPPRGLDYDLWCGPSEKLPYIFARHHRNWRWHDAYGGGQLMDWIGHHNDIAHWGLGMDQSGPEEVEAVGWTFPETDIYNTAVNYEIRCTYPGGITTSISNKNRMGTKWIGEDGWVYVNRGKLDASNRAWIREKFDRGPVKARVSRDHRRDFLDAVRSREECICPAETAHRSITPGHLGMLSQALGRKIRWNAESESVVNDPEAEKMLKRLPYRKPWSIT